MQNSFNFGDILDFIGTLTFDLPTIKAQGLAPSSSCSFIIYVSSTACILLKKEVTGTSRTILWMQAITPSFLFIYQDSVKM